MMAETKEEVVCRPGVLKSSLLKFTIPVKGILLKFTATQPRVRSGGLELALLLT